MADKVINGSLEVSGQITQNGIQVIEKNLYHLGAYDTVDTSNADYDLITRQTGYLILDGRTEQNYDVWDAAPTFWTPRPSDMVAFSGGYYDVCYDAVYSSLIRTSPANVKSNEGTIGCGNGWSVFVLWPAGFTIESTVSDLRTYLSINPVHIQYKLATYYTEKVIKNQSLNTLDQQGSQWVRNEWEKTMQLWNEHWENGYYKDGTGEKISDNNYIRSADKIGVKSGGTYSISAPVLINVYGFNNETYVGMLTNTAGQSSWTSGQIIIPSNVNQIVFNTANTGTTSYSGGIMVNEGGHAYPYVPYATFNGFLKEEYNKTLNLFDMNACVKNGVQTQSAVTSYSVSNNKLSVTYSSASDGYLYFKQVRTLKAGTYTLSFNSTKALQQIGLTSVNSTSYISYTSGSSGNIVYTFSSDATVGFGVEFMPDTADTAEISVMLNYGLTAYPYQPYSGEIVHTADLPESGTKLYQHYISGLVSQYYGAYLISTRSTPITNNDNVMVLISVDNGAITLTAGTPARYKIIGVGVSTGSSYYGLTSGKTFTYAYVSDSGTAAKSTATIGTITDTVTAL